MTDVKGYTPLSDAQKELANEGKVLEERYLRFITKVVDTATSGEQQRCAAIARTKMQEASMWATRAIFQPTRIALPEDNPERST